MDIEQLKRSHSLDEAERQAYVDTDFNCGEERDEDGGDEDDTFER